MSLPPTWLEPQTADCVVRFIHSNYNERDAASELANIFPAARDLTFDPISLRSIFLAVAKSGRDHSSPARVQANSKGTEA